MGSIDNVSPCLVDLNADNITQNVNVINSRCPNPRLKFVLERLVHHLHEFARETQLSSTEWMNGLLYLIDVGKVSTDVRNEFAFLSDVLGLSLLVDSINHPKPPRGTEGSLLGPYHSHGAKASTNGSVIVSDPDGEPCVVVCSVKDTNAQSIEGVTIDIWSTDSDGFYDLQKEGREGNLNQRAVMHSDGRGMFWFKTIVPAPYPVPSDGPVGDLLRALNRHFYRPSHMHFKLEKDGYDPLITALYRRGDPYETSDVVFGVKDSLIVDYATMRPDQAYQYDVEQGSKLMTYEFVMVTEGECRELRETNAVLAMKALGFPARIVEGLPVPDVD